jgi:hypothetical protein
VLSTPSVYPMADCRLEHIEIHAVLSADHLIEYQGLFVGSRPSLLSSP